MSKKITCAFALAAIALFKEHKDLKEVHVTSDGQGFTDHDKAEDKARYLKDKDVKTFKRGFEATYQEDGSDLEDNLDANAVKRNTLLADYMYVFGKEAPEEMEIEDLEKVIAQGKEDLKAEKEKLRPALIEKYEKLFGRKPNHAIGIDKLQAQVEEKEKEVANL